MSEIPNNPALPEADVYLFGCGDARRAYLLFGCHELPERSPSGTPRHRFVVWAPHARAVSLVGDFNEWNASAHPMEQAADGIWCCVAEGLRQGDVYKYAITGADGQVHLKADPFAFHCENGLATASKVWHLDGYTWRDDAWRAARAAADIHREPMNIYEVQLGSWRVGQNETLPNYRIVADQLVKYCKQMAYTHVELLPLTEFPFPGSWGYQATGYFAPTSRYGTPQDFMYLVDTLHAAGIGVILDWVPAHFPKDAFALARFDGTPLYEYADPRKAEHPEWGTLVFDYEKPQVVSFLVSSAIFFLDVYHIDGLRVDAVTSMLYLDYARDEWVPNIHGGSINLEAVAFLRKLNAAVAQTHPEAFTIAEESTSYPQVTAPVDEGGLGFAFKWDMGFMHDTLDYCSMDPLFRRNHHDKLTFGLMYAFNEHYILPYSHDEVVHGKKSMVDKMFGGYLQKFATLRALMGWQFARPGKKLTFMGSEFAQFIEWDFKRELDWFLLKYPIHNGMKRYSAALNRLYASHPALWADDDSWQGFAWANVDDRDESAIAALRHAPAGWAASGDGVQHAPDASTAPGEGESPRADALGKMPAQASVPDILCCCNFTPNPVEGFTVGLPCRGHLRLVLDSDQERFGGTNTGAKVVRRVSKTPFAGHPYSAKLLLPPMSAVFYEFVRTDDASASVAASDHATDNHPSTTSKERP